MVKRDLGEERRERRRTWRNGSGKTKGTVGLRWTWIRGAKSGFVQAPGSTSAAGTVRKKDLAMAAVGLMGEAVGDRRVGCSPI